MTMTTMIGLVFLIALLCGVYATINFIKVNRMQEGTKEMQEIATAIREGANTFLKQEYFVLWKVIILVAIFLGVCLQLSSTVAFMLGALMSGLAGYIGMQASTLANVRVANTARTTKNRFKTLSVALLGGSVMGLSVSVLSMLGLVPLFLIFGYQIETSYTINMFGLEFSPFSMTLTAYGLGCSTIAIFNRVGGGIYTKAADMGADLVGKNEEDIPEDDPRNPGVIADCVGDNVGDTAGLGSDLLESYVGSIVAGIVFLIYLFNRYHALGLEFSEGLFQKLCMYPILFATIGLLASTIGLISFFLKEYGDNPHTELNKVTWIAAGLTTILNGFMTYFLFIGENFGDLPFRLGACSLFASAFVGICSGIAIGKIAEYYTSYEETPTQKIAEASKEGSALNITQGLAVGMKSTLLTALTLGVALILSYFFSGGFGVAMAAVGMLSFITVMVSVDTYGPISDNAGGIAEMAGLGKDIRKITDELDAVGNTTAAIGKGFSIGSAAFAAVSLMVSYMYSFSPIDSDVTLNVMHPMVLAGMMIGASISFYFSGSLIESVAKAAGKMVVEIRRQFDQIVGLKEGKSKPDYKACVKIATDGALAEMRKPALLAILVPLVSGFVMGANFVAGILIGGIIAGIMLAIFSGNTGGAWDNSKKLIESLGLKGTTQHKAAVVGDTVGDPLKDTSGPALNILIKIMSTIALLMVPVFSKFNILAALIK